MNPLKLSIFEEKAVQNGERIYVHGIQRQVREIFKELGGVTNAIRLAGFNYVGAKEWAYRGKPILLSNLVHLLNLLPKQKRLEYQKSIESKELFLSGRYSSLTGRFPASISKELAYVAGIILGDGTLSGDNKKRKRAWKVRAVFDDLEHAAYYNKTMANIFGLEGGIYKKKNKNCYGAGFGSIFVHWFFRSYFGFHTGKKAHKIEIPKRILRTKNPALINACLQGLFDSDGSVAPSNKEVKFASVSKKIVMQISKSLQKQGITVYRSQWLKDPKYRMLYSVQSTGKKNLLRFNRIISFSHPAKQKKLINLLQDTSLTKSPVV